MTNIQVGGVGFSELFQGDNRGAFNFFMENAKSIQILTDSSISALTLIVELNPDIESPYLYLNPSRHNFMTSVRKILLKIMPTHKSGDFKIISPFGIIKRGQHKKEDEFHSSIEINSIEQITRECDIQKEIYRESMLDPELPFVPSCPAVLHLENQITDPEQFEEYILHKIISRGLNNYQGHFINDLDVVQSFLSVQPRRAYRDIRQYGGGSPNNGTPLKKKGKMESSHVSPKHRVSQPFKPYSKFGWVLSPLKHNSPMKVVEEPVTKGNYSIIVMEYLDGYLPLSMKMHEINQMFAGNKKMLQYINQKINVLLSLEVRRLHQLGYYHNDLHTGNIMINLDELYATQDQSDSANTGKVMIIDFGRVLPAKHPKLPKVCKPSLNTDDCIKNEYIFKKYAFILKSIDECVELMDKMHGIGESRKMGICSALGISDCAGKSLSQIIIDELAESPLILSGGGGGCRKSSSNVLDQQLLRQVIINSLRQTETYDELHQYLIRYQYKHAAKLPSPKKKLRNTKKTGRRLNSHGQTPLSTAVSVMSGGQAKINKTRKHKKRC